MKVKKYKRVAQVHLLHSGLMAYMLTKYMLISQSPTVGVITLMFTSHCYNLIVNVNV